MNAKQRMQNRDTASNAAYATRLVQMQRYLVETNALRAMAIGITGKVEWIDPVRYADDGTEPAPAARQGEI